MVDRYSALHYIYWITPIILSIERWLDVLNKVRTFIL